VSKEAGKSGQAVGTIDHAEVILKRQSAGGKGKREIEACGKISGGIKKGPKPFLAWLFGFSGTMPSREL
jgi:hypothetical protein